MTTLTKLRKLAEEANPKQFSQYASYLDASSPATILSLLDLVDEMAEALMKATSHMELMATWDKGDNGYYKSKSALSKYQVMKGE